MTDPTGGPKTQAGKEVARWNATRYGIRSPAPVIPGLEKAEDWEEHRDGVLKSLSPEGHLELVLAERVALLSWRLHRVTRFERETIALSQEKVEEDLMERQQRFGRSIPKAMSPQDVRMEYEEAEKTQRLLKKVSTLPADKRLSTEEAAHVLLSIWNRVDEERA
jgi:dTDP-4-amino-4,6-dideoxygalactose transaminase